MTDDPTFETEGDVREYLEENPDEAVAIEEMAGTVYFIMEDGEFTPVSGNSGRRVEPQGDDNSFGVPFVTVIGVVDRDEVPDAPTNDDTEDTESTGVASDAHVGRVETVGDVWDSLDEGEAYEVAGEHPLPFIEEPIGYVWFVKDQDGETTIIREQDGEYTEMDADDDRGLPPAQEAKFIDADDAPTEKLDAAAEPGPTAL